MEEKINGGKHNTRILIKEKTKCNISLQAKLGKV